MLDERGSGLKGVSEGRERIAFSRIASSIGVLDGVSDAMAEESGRWKVKL